MTDQGAQESNFLSKHTWNPYGRLKFKTFIVYLGRANDFIFFV